MPRVLGLITVSKGECTCNFPKILTKIWHACVSPPIPPLLVPVPVGPSVCS